MCRRCYYKQFRRCVKGIFCMNTLQTTGMAFYQKKKKTTGMAMFGRPDSCEI